MSAYRSESGQSSQLLRGTMISSEATSALQSRSGSSPLAFCAAAIASIVRFLIRKQTLRGAAANDCFWPKAAVALKPSRMSELGLPLNFVLQVAGSVVGG